MLKRDLLGTTGLAVAVTAGVLLTARPSAAQLQLGLGGFVQQFLSHARSDTDVAPGGDGWNGFDVKPNSEVWFLGEVALDNGLTFGVDITLEGNTNPDDQIDESFLFVEGAFGRFNIGSENSAGYLMTHAAPSVGLGVNSTSILTNFLPLSGGFAGADFFDAPLGSTYLELFASDPTDKTEKLTYFTPRFSGFQFGASYLPGPGEDSNAQPHEDTAAFRNGFSLGANFVDSFEGFDVALSGRYDWADADASAEGDPSLWSVGLNLGYAGVTLGGSYAQAEAMGINSGRGFDLGISYEAKPWAASFTWFDGRAEADPLVAGDSRYDAYEAAVSYTIGAGVTALGSVSYQDLQADTGEFARTWAVVGGLLLEF